MSKTGNQHKTQEAPGIGLLNQRSLHSAIREWYALPGDRFETKVDGFIVDIVRGDLLIEIQTANLAAVSRKLHALAAEHKVLLVFPIPIEKHIIRVTKRRRKVLSRRRSPKRGALIDLFDELVRIPHLLNHENFALEVLMTREEEIRCDDGKGSWRRKGVSITDRKLVEVVDRVLFRSKWDFLQFVPADMDQPFTNKGLSERTGSPVHMTRKITYCLKKMGVIKEVGKQGHELLFERAAAPSHARPPSA
jgi:hypothetical protein